MANSDMLVRIKANTDNYNAGIAKASRTLNQFKQDNLTMGGIINQSTKSIVAAAAQYASFAAVLGTVASGFAEAVSTGEAEKGILICGTGIGISIAANKVKGVRASVCSEHFSTKYTRLHNDANILCLGARVIGEGLAIELVDIFLDTEAEGGRHAARVDMIRELEAGTYNI